MFNSKAFGQSNSKDYYKEKRCTIKYNITIQLISEKVVWLADNISDSIYNLAMARNCGLLDQLLKDEIILRDKTYIREIYFIYSFKLALFIQKKQFNFIFNSIKETVEYTIERMKLFQFIKQNKIEKETKFQYFVKLNKYFFSIKIINLNSIILGQ
jgi:hypothetical protein